LSFRFVDGAAGVRSRCAVAQVIGMDELVRGLRVVV